MNKTLTIPFLLLLSCLLTSGCSSEDEDYPSQKGKTKNTASTATTKYDYSVYIESSGSLNGYLKPSGEGNFKENIYSLISELNSLASKKSLSLFDINTRIIPAASNADAAQLDAYYRQLDEKTFRQRNDKQGGNQSQSDLKQVFRMVLDSTGAGQVSVLVTDGIFSPGRLTNAQDYFDQQKAGIQLFFSEKLHGEPLATLVLQFYSAFQGRYYYQDNSCKDGSFEQRPYYVFCFGPEAALQQLLSRIRNNSMLKDLRNYLLLTGTKSYAVKPRIRPFQEYYENDADEPLILSHAAKGGRDGKFRVKLGLDLSSLPLGENGLTDRSHYSISPGYTIEKIAPYGKAGLSHELILVADKPITGKLSVTLKKEMPAWVTESNLDTDKKKSAAALEGKTLGIRYLLEGMQRAYDNYTQTTDYFTFSIHVKD